MKDQRFLVFPTRLRQLRTLRQVSQKALALSIQMDQARLCALEKGRLISREVNLVSRISDAMALSRPESHQLQLAFEHDKFLVELQHTPFVRASAAISHLLRASELLTDEELEGLSAEIEALNTSKRRLRNLADRAYALAPVPVGGTPMT